MTASRCCKQTFTLPQDVCCVASLALKQVKGPKQVKGQPEAFDQVEGNFLNFILVGAHGGFVRAKDLSYELTTCHVTYCTRNA